MTLVAVFCKISTEKSATEASCPNIYLIFFCCVHYLQYESMKLINIIIGRKSPVVKEGILALVVVFPFAVGKSFF